MQFCGQSCKFTGQSALENAMEMASCFKQSTVFGAVQSAKCGIVGLCTATAKFLGESTELLKEQ